MHPELADVVALDGIDRALARADRSLNKLKAGIQEAQSTVDGYHATLASVAAERQALLDEDRALRRTVDEHAARRTSANRSLELGLGDPEAAERQLRQLAALVDTAETRQLEVLEALDALEARRLVANEALTVANEALAAATAIDATERPGLLAHRATLAAERVEQHVALTRETRVRYDKLLATKGRAVATVNGDACSACSLYVQPQQIADLQRGLVEPCRGCNRWLVPPPS